MFQEKQGSGFLDVFINTLIYENKVLTEKNNIKAKLDNVNKKLKYFEDKVLVNIDYNNKIIQREDEFKKIKIKNNKIEITIPEINDKLILDVDDFKFIIKNDIIEISYKIIQSNAIIKYNIKLLGNYYF